MAERCALSGSDLKIKFRTILLTSIYIYGGMVVPIRFPCMSTDIITADYAN